MHVTEIIVHVIIETMRNHKTNTTMFQNDD